jgi:uncharacterized membrane protein (UPF0127 family)
MRRVRVVDEQSGTVLAERAEVAEGFFERGVGLIGRRDWVRSDALVIQPCNSIHCFFMSLPIDVAYVDREHVVLRVVPDLKPWRLGPLVWRAHYVVELPSGTLARTGAQPGDHLVLEPVSR